MIPLSSESSGEKRPRRKPKYVYMVREKLIGEAIYEVVATSKAEALECLRNGTHGDMVDSGVDHMGRGIATRLDRVEDDSELGAWEG